jgi:hypothetical protein
MDYIDDDGWDFEALEETGLLDALREISQVQYEIESCRRGSYAVSGDTIDDLKADLINLALQLQSIVEGL